jgi:two-component system, OmpR family, phosphate regulon response regulator PhoB
LGQRCFRSVLGAPAAGTYARMLTDPQRERAGWTGRRVFVVSSDHEFRRELRQRCDDQLLVSEGTRADDADDALRDGAVDLVVLHLRGYAALEAIARIRARSHVPILALVDATVDCVDAIDAGADDYVHVPSPAREVAAKIRGTLRRAGWAPEPANARFGNLEIDSRAREVRIADRPVPMPQREFGLLAFLASSPRRVFTREELLTEVWHASTEWLGPATVTEHIRRLRSRLTANGGSRDWIGTVRGVGYRFDAPRSRT